MGKEENEIRAVQLEAVKRHSIETTRVPLSSCGSGRVGTVHKRVNAGATPTGAYGDYA